jgi:8-oxo-dGTP pyrophosphatase MutT (NUDIX family)
VSFLLVVPIRLNDGMLVFLANSRADTLRSYAGDTALPGGKVDADDETIEDTAVRLTFVNINGDICLLYDE